MQVFLPPSIGNSSSCSYRAILSEWQSRAQGLANDQVGRHQRGFLVFLAVGAVGPWARRVYHGYEGGAPSSSSVSIHQM
jgi:hypothetical protein